MFINVAAEAVEGDTRTDYQNPLDIIRVRAGGGGGEKIWGKPKGAKEEGVGGVAGMKGEIRGTYILWDPT